MRNNYDIIPADSLPISKSGIQNLLLGIRPHWQGKNLIRRVNRILPADPSSACQRLFNAAIHDLKEKIIVMGIDLAKEVASNNRLPSISREEDVLDYNVSKTVDLAYYMGLLNRPEWRRIHRCYEIRRDLEHEDDEYEAVLEDCFYIFKTTIDVVLSQDPIVLIKVTDAKILVESPDRLTITTEFLEDYKRAPKRRQLEINELLISFAYDEKKPDIVRENSADLMRKLESLTDNTVKIDLAKNIEERIGRNSIDIKSAKIAFACGAIAYFKRSKLKDFYRGLLSDLIESQGDWSNQGRVCRKIEDIGGLNFCPDELYSKMLEKMVEYYIGEPSYGMYRNSRPVFFSNMAAPVIARMVKEDATRASAALEVIRNNKSVKASMEYSPIARRFEKLVDQTEVDSDIE